MTPVIAGLLFAAFMMGSVPFGLIFCKAQGIDPRKVGSGNIGATNVLRAAGKRTAVLTLVFDILKGSASVFLGQKMGVEPVYIGVMGLAAVAGHNFSPFLMFRGGKGVATSVGVILLYVPMAGLITVVLWLFTVIVSRISALGALVSFTLLPLVVYILGYGWENVIISAIISVLLIIRHHSNIAKLINGNERRVGEKK
ncbi:glycerol-3-phosphate 1-O-acyltransferase PlsY [Nitrospirota bacterium]